MNEQHAIARFEQFTVPAPVRTVVEALAQAGHQAFLVGGCVRDVLRGQPPKDFDVATSARPEQVQRLFRRVIPTGLEHGTVTVVQDKAHVEVTTFRAEAEYLDGRRPSKVEFHTDIEADLSRRDFTINAMAFDLVAKKLVDPFGGADDLRARLVRCVRSAMERFLEDGLRPMRAVRFATVLGFEIEPGTEAAIGQTLHVFRKVATERVNQEFTKMLLSPRVATGLGLTRRTGLLAEFAPEAVDADFEAVARTREELTLRLAVLLAGCPSALAVVQRLKFPTKVATDVAHLVTHQQLPAADASDVELRRWLAKVKLEAAEPLLEVASALGRADASVEERVRAQVAARPPLTTKALALNGAQVMEALGVGPSPLIGQATAFLLERVLEEPSRNTPDSLRRLLEGFPRSG
ncbi:MAG: [cytidine(C)-cytidine(C)-adenosine (A)]-adding enzyme [Myxococcaceae bacterium]|nr:[cytidine(C)-cytidine(C)-adenosine (A)]-adding enzyme [Myxococcaceae bacterium]